MSYICKLCQRKFDRYRNYENHKNKKNPCVKKLDCDKCKKSFSRIDSYKRHINDSNCTDESVVSDISDTTLKTDKGSKVDEVNLSPIYNLNNTHIEIKDIRKIITDHINPTEPITPENSKDVIVDLYKLVYSYEKNHVIYRTSEKNRLQFYTDEWKSKKLSKNLLIDILRYMFHTLEAKILKEDLMGTSKVYNDLVTMRQDAVIKHILKNNRSELEDLIPIKNLSNLIKNTKSEKTNNILYSPESKKNCIIEESFRAEERDKYSFDLFKNISPYNSDDEDFYKKSMAVFKNENKLLCPDGSIIDNVYIANELDDEFEDE